ncbi:hypothetical protein [Lysinibacillus capsici]|uniref:hypothetical protein n=1 Tax=Lysinibacillus capsici TaxID=2115968 RepID=UPI0034E54463
MTLLNTFTKTENAYEKLPKGDTSVLATMDSTSKIQYALDLINEFGLPTYEEPKETLADAYQSLIKRQREEEEFQTTQREAQLEKEAKARANKIAASRYY